MALIRWGTTDVQETLTGTLANIVARVRAAPLTPPVVAVIGRVTGLRQTVRWFDPPAREDGAALDGGQRVAGIPAHR